MPLPIFDTQDAIPDAFRPEYEERDGKWHPKGDSSADELAAEKRKRAALLEEKRQEKEKREAAERERDELKRSQEARDKGISEDELQKIRDAETAARRPIEDERDRLKSENRKLKLTDRVQALALKHGVMPDRIEDAMLLLDRRTDLTDADGIAVKDKDGNITAQTIDDFLSKTFKTEKPWLYAGSGSSGSGSSGSSGAGDAIPATEQQKIRERHATTVSRAF